MTNSKKKDLLCAYLIVGEDKLRQKAVMKKLQSRMNEYGDMSFNTSVFDGGAIEDQDIINSCNTMPFAADKRLVVVNNAQNLPKEQSEAIIEYLANPSQTCVLTLVADKFAKNTRLYKAFAKIDPTCIITCENPKTYELQNKVVAIARSHSGSISPDGAAKLIELVGSDTTMLDSEIKKLLLTTQNNNIELNHVVANVKKTAESKPWDFTNYYAAKNVEKSLNTFWSMDDKAAFVLLPMTCKRIRELIIVKSLGSNLSTNDIASKLKLAPWQCKNHSTWARHFTNTQLIHALEAALECDKDIKSGADPKTRFEMFVVETLAEK